MWPDCDQCRDILPCPAHRDSVDWDITLACKYEKHPLTKDDVVGDYGDSLYFRCKPCGEEFEIHFTDESHWLPLRKLDPSTVTIQL